MKIFVLLLIAGNLFCVSASGNDSLQYHAARVFHDRIIMDLENGKISLKESVMLRARLCFAPQRIPADSPYRPPSSLPSPGEEMTGFYKDVHRVKNDLSRDEKNELKAYSPDLDAIIQSWESER